MDLQTVLRILRKRWLSIAVTVAVVLLITGLVTFLLPKTYESRLQFFVSTVGSSDSAELAQGSTFLQQRVKSYSQLLTAPVVLDPVIEQTGLDTTSAELAQQITGTVPPDTVLIDVTVQAGSPEEARQVADAVGQQFPATISEMEKVQGKKASPVKVTLTQPPTLAAGPVSPQPLRNFPVGLIVGLILGLGLAVVRHALDTKLRTKEDVEAVTDELTVIGGVPFDNDAGSHPLLVEADPRSTRAEAFRSLRTNLRFVDAASHPRSIVMTSTLAGEGKTTTTANLALVLAESGASVCLIEGDLRRPRLLEYFGMEGAVGLTDVLIGQAELTDVMQPYGKNNLAIIGAGQLPPNPSELLGSQAMRGVLGTLAEQFDHVLIDAPPLLPVTDAAVLTTIVDGAVMVVGSGLVSRDQFNTALSNLRAVNGRILGVTLNRIPRNARVGGYYYYHYYESRPGPQQQRSDEWWDNKHTPESGARRAKSDASSNGHAQPDSDRITVQR